MSIVKFTRSRCAELADFLEACCAQPLAFDGEHPIQHSSHNHVHLWALEYWADHHRWIDLDYRIEFADFILHMWRGRLKGLAPYRQAGYRMYLYEDVAPTVSVVAETAYGFPYSDRPVFVNSFREIMAIYVKQSWREKFSITTWDFTHSRVLDAIEAEAGSIGRRTANALGISVGSLRILIEQMGLEFRVNEIRKKFKRRPAAFRTEEGFQHTYKIYEQRLPPFYH